MVKVVNFVCILSQLIIHFLKILWHSYLVMKMAWSAYYLNLYRVTACPLWSQSQYHTALTLWVYINSRLCNLCNQLCNLRYHPPLTALSHSLACPWPSPAHSLQGLCRCEENISSLDRCCSFDLFPRFMQVSPPHISFSRRRPIIIQSPYLDCSIFFNNNYYNQISYVCFLLSFFSLGCSLLSIHPPYMSTGPKIVSGT